MVKFTDDIIVKSSKWEQPSLNKTIEFQQLVDDIEEKNKEKRGLSLNLKADHEKFLLETIKKIDPSWGKIDFFELCCFVENESMKKDLNYGNFIRHIGWLTNQKRNSLHGIRKEVWEEVRGRITLDYYPNYPQNKGRSWDKIYGDYAWLSPLYNCWIRTNLKENITSTRESNGRWEIGANVMEEFKKNPKKYVLVETDHLLKPKPTEIRYWLVNKDSLNISGISLGDFVLSMDNGKIVRFDVQEKGGCNIEPPISLEPGLAELSDVKSLEKKEFFNLLKPIALDGVNFFLSSYNIDKGGNQWEKARSNNAVGFNTSKPTTKKIFDGTDPEYNKNYTPKPKDVLLFRRSGDGKEGGLSDIFTIKEVSYDSTKIDKIKNKKPTWGDVDVVVYGEDKRIDLYEQGGCVYEGPYEKTMWSSTFHRWNGDQLNKNDLNGEILKDGLVLSGVLVGYRTFYDYFEHIINGRWWKMIGNSRPFGGDNQFNILRYIVTVYDRMEKIGLGSETGKIVNGESSSVNNDDLIKDIVNETYLEKELVESIVSELLDKKQIVLQGPPGTGKTFVAKKIAECMKRHGFGDEGLVQFHASYSYEEFMEGYKPESGSDGQLKFKIKNGIFKEFCFCVDPIMQKIEVGNKYTREGLSNIFKLNEKENIDKYEGVSKSRREEKFVKGETHGSLRSDGVFCYDDRFDVNNNSIWLLFNEVPSKRGPTRLEYTNSYDRETGVVRWEQQQSNLKAKDEDIINHENAGRRIYIFMNSEGAQSGEKKYEFLGRFCYDSHDASATPTEFVFKKKRKVFIIDEINRGNTSSIFGELMYLLEYRDEKITLPYSKREFRIPKNVLIIGTMNTADRSIAMVDYALRRRFAFFTLPPNPDLFAKTGTNFEIKDRDLNMDVRNFIVELNEKIVSLKKRGLGEGYRIGHSYFIKKGGIDREQFNRVVKHHIKPLIKEYSQMLEHTDEEDLDNIIKKYLKE